MSTLFLLSLLFFTPKLDFELPIPLTYKSDISWDKGFITYYSLKEDVIIGLEVRFFTTFQDYLYQLTLGSYRRSEFEKERASKATGGGILPVIDLPIKFPKPIAGIIGQGGQLDVNGSQRIDFGGSKTTYPLQQDNEFTKDSWFPSLEMEQRLSVDLKGTIGEKVHVFIDHDSEREFDLKNTIKLEYKGDEDEIIQSISAGNTQLSLPGVKLIGGGTPHKGLFGVKSEAKIGPVSITAIASREEAETQSREWSGGGVTEREMKIDDINFIKSRFFMLVPPKYIHSLPDPHNIYVPGPGSPNLLPKEIISLSVHLDEVQDKPGEGKFGTAFDVPNRCHAVPESVETRSGMFVEQLPGDQEFYSVNTLGIKDAYRFAILELNRGLSDGDLLAIRWTYVDHNGDTTTVGEFVSDTLRNLQMIKRERKGGAEDTSYVSWWYESKNRYSLGGANVSDLQLRVFRHNYGSGEDYETLPNSDTTYRKFMGLEADLRIRAGVFDSLRGTITFPSPYPFVLDTLLRPIDSLGMESDSIYDMPNFTNYTPKYYVWIQYKGIKTEYHLDMMGIIKESEVVKINGDEQERGKDYEIDYDFGVITFSTPDAESPSARITVDFQYVPIFQPTTKNLLGTRAHSKIGELGEISSAFLYYSTGCRDFRPTLGSEPGRIVLGELVGNVKTESELLTRWVDKLPLVETESPSSFSVQGNVGFSRPNPNTRGEVYLDDMDGAKSTTSLGLSRSGWSFGSLPPLPLGIDVDDFAQVQWYNPPHIATRELYPDLPERQGNTQKATLLLRLPPENDWRYPTADSVYWTSLQTCILPRGMDFSHSEYLEVWVKGNRGVLHLDIGTDIPEDCLRRDGDGNVQGPNGALDTEDSNDNDAFDEGEDVGIDGVEGTDGTGIPPEDDGNDDYAYSPANPDDYSTINGTEKNNAFDREDIDRNKLLNEESNYFSFAVDIENDVPTVSRENGWKLFRIPLPVGEIAKEGIPQWECTKYARIWIEGLHKGDDLQIAGLDVVGNKWRHEGSENVKIRVKNNWEDKDYDSPPGIELEKDPITKEPEKEQSLVLSYTDLDTTEGSCYTLYTRARNFVQYKSLKFWLRQPQMRDVKFFVRIGGDKQNYYEYRTDLSNTSWQDITIDLEEVAQLKLQKLTTDTLFCSGDYRIRGNPSFTNVGRIELGVINEDSVNKVSGEIWIDEIRLADPRRESGVAGNLSLSTTLADFATLNVTYGGNDPYFQSLGNFTSMREAFATNSRRSLGLQSGVQLSKLLPAQWGVQMPLSLGVTRSSSIPKYQSGSDVILTDRESKRQASEALMRSAGITLSKSGSKNAILRHTLDNISTRFDCSDKSSDAFTTIDSSQSYSGSVSYAFSPPLPPIKFKGLTLKYFPEQINTGTNYSYARARGYRMTEILNEDDTLNIHVDTVYALTNPTPPTRGLGKDGSFSYRPIGPLSFNYGLSISNDLNLDGDVSRFDAEKKRYDTEIGRRENTGGSFSPSLFGFFSPTLNYRSNYQESHGAELNLLRNVSNSNSITFSMPVDLKKTLGIVTGLRNEEQDTAATPGSPHWLLMQTEKIAGKLHLPSLSHSISRSSLFHSLLGPPDYTYRWGMEKEPHECPADDRNRAQITRSYAVNRVGLQAGILSVKGGWSKSMSESETMGMGGETFSRSIQFPQLTASLTGLERFFSLKKQLNSAIVSYDYTTSCGESGPRSEEPNMIQTDKNMGFGVNTRWRRGISLGLTSSFSTSRDENTGIGAKVVDSKKADYGLHGTYTFRAPKGIRLPLLSHIKWESDLNFDLSSTYSTERQKNVKSNAPLRDSRSINVQPKLSYNFSTAVRGGASAGYTQYWDRTGSANTRTIRLGFFAEFSF